MRRVPVAFRGFWPGFAADDFVRRHPYLSGSYELVLSTRPEVVFYSVFPDEAPPPENDHVRVFYTGEAVSPDLERYDFAISFERVDHPRHLYLPNYVARIYLAGYVPEALLERPAATAVPGGFCSYVFRNSVPHREQLFAALTRIGRVDSPGVSMQNVARIEGGISAKLDFLRRYKFTVAYENRSAPGYTTEKLIEARLAGVVPLYWGDPEVGETFDTTSFINRHEYLEEQDFLARVAEVHADDDLYRAIRARPFLRDGRLPDHMRADTALRFFDSIFAAGAARNSSRTRPFADAPRVLDVDSDPGPCSAAPAPFGPIGDGGALAAGSGFRAIAFFDEVVDSPELLVEFGMGFASRDGAELIVHAPELSGAERELEEQLAPLAAALGLDRDGSANVIVLTDPVATEALAATASVVYTRRPRPEFANLPRAADVGELLRLAAAEACPVPAEVGQASATVLESGWKRLLAEKPQFHQWEGAPISWNNGNPGSIERFLRPGMRTLETGSGYSTVVFAAAGCEHVAVTPERIEADRIAAFCREHGYRLPTFHIGPSQDVLPRLPDIPLEAAFIDGAHAFPFPILDWFYIDRLLRIGGLLFVDDLQLMACFLLDRYLSRDRCWEEVHREGNLAVFRKVGTYDFPHDYWAAQEIGAAPVTDLQSFLAGIWPESIGAVAERVPPPLPAPAADTPGSFSIVAGVRERIPHACEASTRVGTRAESKLAHYAAQPAPRRTVGPDGTVTGPPDFIGVGAMKAGTSWWHALIEKHPEVHAPAGFHKEARTFCDPWEPGQPFDGVEYARSFARPAGTIVGEWSPDHLWYWWGAQMLRIAAPDAKLLFLVRDPLERFVSQIGHALMHDQPIRRRSLAKAFAAGLYGRQLVRLLRWFPREQILVLQYERCVADPAGELARTYRFLGIDDRFVPEGIAEPVHETTVEKPILPPGFRARLVEKYRRDAVRLHDLAAGIDVSLWASLDHGSAPGRARQPLGMVVPGLPRRP